MPSATSSEHTETLTTEPQESIPAAPASTEKWASFCKNFGSGRVHRPSEYQAWIEKNGIRSEDEAWVKLDQAELMLYIADTKGVRFDESKLRLFACDCAEASLRTFEEKYPRDKRPRQALETARRFAKGEVAEEELTASSCAAADAREAIEIIWERLSEDHLGHMEATTRFVGHSPSFNPNPSHLKQIESAMKAASDAGLAAGAAMSASIPFAMTTPIAIDTVVAASKAAGDSANVDLADRLRFYFPHPFEDELPLKIQASDFAKYAAKGPAWSRLPIRQIPQIIAELNAQLDCLNIPPEALHDLYNNSLLGVCPRCNEYCAGKAFLRMPLLAAVGDKLSFTGNSGGFERMLEGTCLNYSCTSVEFDLFWCPDLDGRMFQNLRDRGINLDPHVQQKRNDVWKPQPADAAPKAPATSATLASTAPTAPVQAVKIPSVAPATIQTIVLVATNDQASISGFQNDASFVLSVWASKNTACWSFLKNLPQPPCSVYVEPHDAPGGRTGVALKFAEGLINRLYRGQSKTVRIFLQLGGVTQLPQGKSGPRSFCLLTICEVSGLNDSEIVSVGGDELILG